MKQLIPLLIFSLFVTACGSKQPSPKLTEKNKSATVQPDNAVKNFAPEAIMWETASYAGNLGDNKNTAYITNTYAIWGTYSNNSAENGELKIKFLIDKASFCLKLYEYGKKIVKRGDETYYKISIRSDGLEPLQITARNVSDRIFISEIDAKKIIELFDNGNQISFSMVTDSKTSPSTYTFTLEHPGGFKEILSAH
ncbi:MAG TPA: hypothetical protein VIK10_01975 [Prolixibacteraceae bacterium]